MVRFVIHFSSVEATFSSSRVRNNSVRSLRWISEFLILAMKISRIHSSSPADMWHLFAIPARALQNCSNDSLSLCFLIKNLWLSNVTLVFLTKATDSFFRTFWKKIGGFLLAWIFWPKIFFPSFPRALGLIRNFCQLLRISCRWIALFPSL